MISLLDEMIGGSVSPRRSLPGPSMAHPRSEGERRARSSTSPSASAPDALDGPGLPGRADRRRTGGSSAASASSWPADQGDRLAIPPPGRHGRDPFDMPLTPTGNAFRRTGVTAPTRSLTWPRPASGGRQLSIPRWSCLPRELDVYRDDLEAFETGMGEPRER